MRVPHFVAFFGAALFLVMAALPVGAQAPQSFVNFNAYHCPAGYDQVQDCTKLDGVVVDVTQDGQPLGQLTSSATEGAELEVMWGAAIALTVVGGQPIGTVQESANLAFDAVEGANPVTVIFVAEAEPAPPPASYLNLYAWHCPADYAHDTESCARLADVFVDVKQDGQAVGQIKTLSNEGAILDLMWGAFIELEIAGGVPERADLESDLDLSFTAEAGENPAMLVFVAQEDSTPPPTSYLNLNAWHCPADYDQVSDCAKLADVYVNVKQDGQPLGQVVTKSDEGATLDLMAGAFIELEIAGGVPERTDLEDTALSFTAVEGANAVTLIFVDQAGTTPPPPHSDTNALVAEALLCPVEYAGNNYVRDCLGEEGIEVKVTRDADGFSVTDQTGAEGLVGFQGLGEGTYTVELGVPGDFADFQTVCGTPDGFEPREVTNPNTNRIGVYLGPQEELTCTFFIIPVDATGEPAPKPTPTKPGPSVPVKELPKTGAGAASADAGHDFLQLFLGTSLLLGFAGTLLMTQRRRI